MHLSFLVVFVPFLWIYVINWGHVLLFWLVFLADKHGSNKYSIYLSRNAFYFTFMFEGLF